MAIEIGGTRFIFQLNSAVFFLSARCHLMGILAFELSHLF
jgi:hypothetical protein